MEHDGPNTVRRRRESVVLPELDRPERPSMNAFPLDLAMLVFGWNGRGPEAGLERKKDLANGDYMHSWVRNH